MDLVKTILLYLTMVISAATGVSPEMTPIPASQVATPAPYVTATPDPQSLITPAPTAAPTHVPKTGDGANLVLWIGLILLGFLGIIAFAGMAGRKHRNR